MFDRLPEDLPSDQSLHESEAQTEDYALNNPESESQASLVELLKDENTKTELLIDEAFRKLDSWTAKSGLDFSVERAKLEQKRQDARFEQHLNFVELFNMMIIGASVDRTYAKLSGASKELYRIFVQELPASAHDNTQEAVLEIAKTIDSFNHTYAVLPKDLTAMFKRYYEPFRDAAKQLQKKQAAETAHLPKQTAEETMDPETLRRFLQHI